MNQEKELIKVARNGNLQKIKDLVAQGVDIHIYNEATLHWAVYHGQLEVVKFLVDQGADIHAKNDHALRLAAEYGHLDIVKYLVSQGADVHANNKYAFRLAVVNSHQEVVDYLKNYEKPKEVFNLKALNTDGRLTCAKCGMKLNMPIGLGNKYNYCPVCEG